MGRYKIQKKGKMSVGNRVRQHRLIQNLIKKKREEVEEQEFATYYENVNSSGSNIRKEKTIREHLRSWANTHAISARAINDLLKILILAGNYILCVLNS